MTQQEARELVAEVLVLRNSPQWRAEDDELIVSGKVLNSQVGGKDVRERTAQLREMAPGPLILQSDLETGSYFAADGTEIPPLMALGAAADEQLAYDWGYAVGLEGLRLGLDVTWSPVLDINTNPDNPIINVRSFGEQVDLVSRLGAALTRGMLASGLTPCAKHWPGHGDVAVDSHISLPTLPLTRERLETVEWEPYRHARRAGLECIMTAHLLVTDIDPENCATVSPTLIGMLKKDLGFPGPIFTDSLGMEGLRLTLDSAEAAWKAVVAGHAQVLVDYKRSPVESYEAVLAAAVDGRIPEARLREAAATVRAFKAKRAAVAAPPTDEKVRETLHDMARRVAEASITAYRAGAAFAPGSKPLLVICDDLASRGVGLADEQKATGLQGTHPLAKELTARLPFEVLVFEEAPTADDLAQLKAAAAAATDVIGATFAHIVCYKGEGVRLPAPQVAMWQDLAATGKLRQMLLFESPYALSDLPEELPVVVGYGADSFTLKAAARALLGEASCPGKLPVTV